MEVCRVYWWEHDCKTPKVSSAKIHRALKVTLKEGVSAPRSFDDYDIALTEIEGVKPEVSLDDKAAYLTLEKDVPNEVLTKAVVDAGYEVISIDG